MSTNSGDFRKIINLLESNDNSEESLNEGPLINKALGKLGNKKAQGRVERDDLAKPMIAGYKKWLGRTNRSGTLDDIQLYLNQIGFEQNQTQNIVKDYLPASNGVNPNTANPSTVSDEPTASEPSTANSKSTLPSTPATPTAPMPMSTPTSASVAASAANPPAPDINALKASKDDALNKWNKSRAARDTAVTRHQGLSHNPEAQTRLNKQIAGHNSDIEKHRSDYHRHNNHLKSLGHGLTANPRDKLVAGKEYTGNKIMELNVAEPPLSGSETNKIFSNAAAFAHDNNLVRSRVMKLVGSGGQTGSTQGNNYGGYASSQSSNDAPSSTSNHNSSSSPSSSISRQKDPARDAIDTLHGDIFSICKREGMTAEDIQELKSTVKSKSRLSSITDANDKQSLALIGYAFLKTTK